LPGAYFEDVLKQMQERLAATPLPLQIPIGEEEFFQGVIDLITQKAIYWEDETPVISEIPADMLAEAQDARQHLLETLAEYDETIFAKFFDEPENITETEIRKAVRSGTLAREFVPVLCGSAYKNKGIQPVLDAVCAYLPSPADLGNIKGIHPRSGNPEERSLQTKDPFSALVFKIALDDQHRKMAFFRVYSGLVRRGQNVTNARSGKKEKMANLYQMHGGKHKSMWEIKAGDIAALGNVKDITTGDTLCDTSAPILLETIQFPEPVIGMAIEARHSRDLDRMIDILHQLEEEDPSFKVIEDAESGQTIIRGMGELHLEVIAHRLRDDFNLEVNLGRPQVNYREQLGKTIAYSYEYIREVGDPLHALLSFEIGPADPEFLESSKFLSGRTRLQLIPDFPEGAIRPEYLAAVQNSFEQMLFTGVLAGFELHHLKIRITDAQQFADSSELAFDLCARKAFRRAAPNVLPACWSLLCR